MFKLLVLKYVMELANDVIPFIKLVTWSKFVFVWTIENTPK